MSFQIPIPPDLKTQGNRPVILAHRGCRAQAPENSIPAFELALAQGANVLETDLQITKDRELLCIHDATVDRTTNGSGPVNQMTLTEIKQLHVVGNNDSAYPEASVPTLVELLDTFADQTFFALELKSSAFAQPADAELLLNVLADHNALDRVLILSFSRQALNFMEQLQAPTPLALITLTNPWPSAKYPMVGPWWPLLYANPAYVAISHRRGQFCCPLDPTPEQRLAYYLRLGVDALLSDDPEKTLQALNQYGLTER
jgi:glycerophosphoryl diester phosphodiesterase